MAPNDDMQAFKPIHDDAAIQHFVEATPICDTCKAFFKNRPCCDYAETPHSLNEGVAIPCYHRERDDFMASVKTGCMICNYIFRRATKSCPGNEHDLFQGPYRNERWTTPVNTYWEFSSIELAHIYFAIGDQSGEFYATSSMLNRFLSDYSNAANHNIGPLVVNYAEFPTCLRPKVSKLPALVRHWVNCCLNTHLDCSIYRGMARKSPRRILDIEGARVLLRELPETGWHEKYITLSHRWGDFELPRLLKPNKSKLQSVGIDPERLPQTFQDAITVSRWLGVRYLWIDSLCILQDSLEDWESEAALMGDIYGGGLLNIAATDAVAFGDGFLQRYRATSAQDETVGNPTCLVVSSHENRALETMDKYHPPCREPSALLLHTSETFQEQVGQSVLLGRGWVHQEVLLAPATLYFTQKRAWWQCADLTCGEVYPSGLPYFIRDSVDIDVRLSLPRSESELGYWRYHDRLERVTLRGRISGWRNMVQRYSAAAFTQPWDKLVALSGVTKLLSDHLGVYHSGLWIQEDDEVYPTFQLLWRASSPPGISPKGRQNVERLKGRAGKRAPIVPSWSWASSTKSVSYVYGLDSGRSELARIASRPSACDLDVFGWPQTREAAMLHLTGFLVPVARLLWLYGNGSLTEGRAKRKARVEFANSGNTTARILFDTWEDYDELGQGAESTTGQDVQGIEILPIWWRVNPGKERLIDEFSSSTTEVLIEGLALKEQKPQPGDHGRRVFTRLGSFRAKTPFQDNCDHMRRELGLRDHDPPRVGPSFYEKINWLGGVPELEDIYLI